MDYSTGDSVIDKMVALQVYNIVKENFAKENERHSKVVAGFADVKAEIRKESEHHNAVMAGFADVKVRIREERERHNAAMAGFADVKARIKAENERHAIVVAKFQADAAPWRKITREEKAIKLAREKEEIREIDKDIEKLSKKDFKQEMKDMVNSRNK